MIDILGPPPQEQPDHRRRRRRRQDGARRGPRARIAEGDVPDSAQERRTSWRLDLGALQAGAGVKGEFENRLKGVITEVKASPKPIVLFIDEAHTIIGAGGRRAAATRRTCSSPRSRAASCARSRPRPGPSTRSTSRRTPRSSAASSRSRSTSRRSRVAIAHAPRPRAAGSRRRTASSSTTRRCAAAVRALGRYITGRQLPDKAVDLLDTCAGARQGRAPARSPPSSRTREARWPRLERELEALRARLRRRASRSTTRRRSPSSRPSDASSRTSSRRSRRASTRAARRSSQDRRAAQEMAPPRPATERDALRARRSSSPSSTRHQSQEDAARPRRRRRGAGRARSSPTGRASPSARWSRTTSRPSSRLEDRLRTARIKGQDYGARAPSRRSSAPRAPGSSRRSSRMGVFLLVGPSGVGKTETALSLADLLFGGERFIVDHQHVRVPGAAHRLAAHRLAARLRRLRRGRRAHRGGAPAPLLGRAPRRVREGRHGRAQPLLPGVRQGHARRRRGPASSTSRTPSSSSRATSRPTSSPTPRRRASPAAAARGPHLRSMKPTLSAPLQAGAPRPHDDGALPARSARRAARQIAPHQARRRRQRRAKEAHGIELGVDPTRWSRPSPTAAREVESGARNVDHILRGTVLPLVSARS